MQEQHSDGSYGAPELLELKKALEEAKPAPMPEALTEATKRVASGAAKRILIFAGEDEAGDPTPELRRAWRRYNKSQGHRRD